MPAEPDTASRGLVVVVEDERAIADVIGLYLRRDGFGVHTETDGPGGLAAVRRLAPAAVVLDVGLPGLDGVEVCRRLRAEQNWTPILFVTARDDEVDRILGLELGADDYVTKPFSPRELRARIKAVLRRQSPGAASPGETFRFGDVDVDFARAEVRRDGRAVDLTKLEFKLLETFIRRRSRLLTRDQLLEAAWDHNTHVTDRAVDAHIVNLRRKIEPRPAKPQFLQSVRGLGYRFDG